MPTIVLPHYRIRYFPKCFELGIPRGRKRAIRKSIAGHYHVGHYHVGMMPQGLICWIEFQIEPGRHYELIYRYADGSKAHQIILAGKGRDDHIRLNGPTVLDTYKYLGRYERAIDAKTKASAHSAARHLTTRVHQHAKVLEAYRKVGYPVSTPTDLQDRALVTIQRQARRRLAQLEGIQ